MATLAQTQTRTYTKTEAAAVRSLKSRQAAYIGWATCDRDERAAKMRAARWDRYEAQVDPRGTLKPAERRRRAEALMKADMAQLARRSVEARAAKKTAVPKLATSCHWCDFEACGYDGAKMPTGTSHRMCDKHNHVFDEAIRRGIIRLVEDASATTSHHEPQPAA